MIDDKTAKMAINTLKAYCDQRQCGNCAVNRSCDLAHGTFKYFAKYLPVGEFEALQKPLEKAPKFDVALYDSPLFSNYTERVAKEEAKKVGLIFIGGLDKVKCYPNGTIKVWYKSEDGETVYKGKAKCHQNDAFNPEIGIKLAVQRIAEKINKPFVPTDGETYYYVGNDAIHIYVNHYENKDVFNIALGNCFKTFEQADAHKDAIMKRIERAKVLLESLREDDVIHQ